MNQDITTPASTEVANAPAPPSLHWAIVLLLNIVVSSLILPEQVRRQIPLLLLLNGWIFGTFWLLVQARFMRKITGDGHALSMGSLAAAALVLGWLLVWVSTSRYVDLPGALEVVEVVALLAAPILYIFACFSLRDAMEDYYSYSQVVPASLSLSGFMTFFFGTVYLQYHFCRIASLKKAGYPQTQ